MITEFARLSPLRYPGGKSRAVPILRRYLPKDTEKICSPFFGGGSFELASANAGYEVYGYDIFSPLVIFWQTLLENNKLLADKIKSYYPLTKDKFYSLQRDFLKEKNKLTTAAEFYVLNRASFSGATLSGGMSPGHPRFTRNSIAKIENFNVKNFSVTKRSFVESIKYHANDFIYADPPYLIESSLYGYKGDTHRDFHHETLRDILKKRNNWVLSYNYCETILDMYKGFDIHHPKWQYGMSHNKSSKEILILSEDIKENYATQTVKDNLFAYA